MKPIDRFLLVLIVVSCVIGAVAIRNLDQDDALINRGQESTTCIGDRQDEIDKWRGIATAEFVVQSDRGFDQGLSIETALALRAEASIIALVDEKQDLRQQQRDLIAEDKTAFDCAPIADVLVAPPLDELFPPEALAQLPPALRDELGM